MTVTAGYLLIVWITTSHSFQVPVLQTFPTLAMCEAAGNHIHGSGVLSFECFPLPTETRSLDR